VSLTRFGGCVVVRIPRDDDDDDNIDGLPFWGLDKKVSCCFMRVSDKYTDIPLR
jgi:hypothetical protein